MPYTIRRPAAAPHRRAAMEAQVLAATERLLAAGATFTELGVQHIAAEAGVARSTFYLYFRDKIDLALQLAATLSSSAFNQVTRWDPSSPNALDELTDTMLRVIHFYRERRYALAAVLEVAGYDRAVAEFWDSELDRFVQNCRSMLITEQAAGRTSADMDPLIASRVIVWGGMRVIADQVTSNTAENDPTVAHELATSQWHAAFRRPPHP